MSERCEVCDRPKAITSAEITPETCGVGVVDRPIDDSISQCDARSVDWRRTALECGAAYARDMITIAQQRNSALARADAAEQSLATANETIRDLDDLLGIALTRVRFHAQAGSEGARATLAVVEKRYATLAPRNAAERGEAKGESEP